MGKVTFPLVMRYVHDMLTVDDTELLMDLLRHAGQVEVAAPAPLRKAFAQRLRDAVAALLDKEKPGHRKYARLAKLTVGWVSHLYYWMYPGILVAFAGTLMASVVLPATIDTEPIAPLSRSVGWPSSAITTP